MKKWQILDSGVMSAKAIMEKDCHLHASLDPAGVPILHFYEWEAPSATYGYFLKPAEVLKTTDGLDLARRPTGGGLLFHTFDFAFSILLPSTSLCEGGAIEQYRFVNALVIEALQKVFPANYVMIDETSSNGKRDFCMAQGTKYDVFVNEKKIVGAAQRAKKQGILHQGTISLTPPDPIFLHKYLSDELVEEMVTLTYAPSNELQQAKKAVKAALQDVMR